MKNIVDFWGSVLFIPEYPAVLLRDIYLAWRSRYNDINLLNDELLRLRNENALLRREVSRVSALSLFASDDLSVSSVRSARVTLRAPMSWWSEIRLDRGINDNITLGMPLFSGGYLVGRVSTVSLLTSWAELITSPSFMIPAVVDDTRELGVVCGDGSGSVLLRYIPSGRTLKHGMKVSTAMFGELLPAGLPIGRIAGDPVAGSDGYSTYRVETGADMSGFYIVNY